MKNEIAIRERLRILIKKSNKSFSKVNTDEYNLQIDELLWVLDEK